MFNIEVDKGMGYIKTLLLFVVIVMLVASGIYFIRVKRNEEYIETIKTNMLLIEWKIKDYINNKTIAGEEKEYIGTKVSDMANDAIIKPLLDNNIISKEDYDKYYVLTNSDLEKLTSEIINEANSYYIINYETYDILITKGCSYKEGKILYRLEEIKNANN